MTQPTSPWNVSVDRTSPDGRYRAIITDAGEVARGAPRIGTLSISDLSDGRRVVARFQGCNPSLVWSGDSAALAVPQWTRGRMKKLNIVAVPSGAIIAEAEGFRVLELHEF